LLYWGYLLARVLARVAPLGLSYWIAERIADLWYVSSPGIREDVGYNLGLVPGLPEGDRSRAVLTRRIMQNFARVVTEFLYLPRLTRENLHRLVDLDSFASLREVMKRGPTILVTAHLGNWELAAATIAMLGIDLYVVVYDHPDPRVAGMFRQRRQAKGLKVMSVKEAAREITRSLRTASVGIVGDRDYSGQGSEVRLLGQPVRVPTAYARLAASLDVPVIVGFCVRHGDGKYRLTLEKTVHEPPERMLTAEEIIEDCVRMFEKAVEKYPEQWYFFERVGGQWGAH
jgi:KDO2-lipid IV(A) lauroyltransferase